MKRSAASIPELRYPILKKKASISTETLVPTYKRRRRYNAEENNIQLFQVARGFSVSLYTVTHSNLCHRTTAIMFGKASLIEMHITVLSTGFDKRLFHCMNE